MAMAMEATPRRARGIVAGFTQQGFAAGYMLASGFHLAMGTYLNDTPKHFDNRHARCIRSLLRLFFLFILSD
jgi:hypothetical protein